MMQERDAEPLDSRHAGNAPDGLSDLGNTGSQRNPRAGMMIYGVLVVLWLAVSGWQIYEHIKLRRHSQEALLKRASDIAATLEVVVRSQERFGTITKHRLQAALTELSRISDVLSVALFSPNGDIVASAGVPFAGSVLSMSPGETHWEPESLALAEGLHLIPLGSDDPAVKERQVVLIERPPRPPPDENGPTGNAPPQSVEPGTNDEDRGRPAEHEFPSMRPTIDLENMSHEDMKAFIERMRQHRRGGRRPGRPSWLSDTEYQELFEKFGLQKFIISLSAVRTRELLLRDSWQRVVLAAIALVAVAALAMGVRSREQAADLEMRLVRAREMNTHLREMNAAAAGLAHETRNPLNVMRGLAQIIRKKQAAPDEVSQNADTIIEEVDRVNSRLDQFICYAKPCEPQLQCVDLEKLVSGISDALQYDTEEKGITLSQDLAGRAVLADAEMLRQVVFNLVLNACQAVNPGGSITISASGDAASCMLRISDDGPGIPRERREDIFRPYVTYSEQGTGLGLAIVRQIVLAHHWDITCGNTEAGGAEFCISGMSPVHVSNRG